MASDRPSADSEQSQAGSMVALSTSERVDGISMRCTTGGHAIADFEFKNGDERRVVFTREQAEAFREQIADTYRMHDENTGGQPGDRDE